MVCNLHLTRTHLANNLHEQMFEIASDGASRLVTLTTEFPDYAYTRTPKLTLPPSLTGAGWVCQSPVSRMME